MKKKESKVGVRNRWEKMLVTEQYITEVLATDNANFYNSTFTKEMFDLLLERLKNNSTVKRLDVGSCNIDSDIAIQLIEILKKNTTIECLYIFLNQIDDRGAAAIAELIEVNSTIQSIYARSNNISTEGAKLIAKAIETNKSLRTLDLIYNEGITEEALPYFCCALQSNTALTYFQIFNMKHIKREYSKLHYLKGSNCHYNSSSREEDTRENITNDLAVDDKSDEVDVVG